MTRRFILVLKRLRKLVPKFYHGEQVGLKYKARPVGFWKRFPFFFLPYLTGDVIWIKLSVKPLFEDVSWQDGILQIDPPVMSDEPLWEGGPLIPESNYVFKVRRYGEWSIGKLWSANLPLKGGVNFHQPCNIKCTLVFQNIIDDKIEQTIPIPIADIEVVSRGPFLTQVCMWVFGLISAGLIGYFINALT